MKNSSIKLLSIACTIVLAILFTSCDTKTPPSGISDNVLSTEAVTDNVTDDEELRYDVTEVKLLCQNWIHKFTHLSFTNAVSLSNSQINGFLDRLSALEFTEEDTVKPYDESCVKTMIVSGEDEYYVYFCRGRILLAPSSDAGYDELKAYNFKGDPIFDYIYDLHNEIRPEGTWEIHRHDPDAGNNIAPDEEQAPDEELRYNVKEVLFFAHYWEIFPDILYPEDAIRLSNAQINRLLDLLSETEFTGEQEGGGLTGGYPIDCVIVAEDNTYSLEFNSGSATLWQSYEEMHTLAGRKNSKTYSVGNYPIIDYIYELHDAYRPNGIAQMQTIMRTGTVTEPTEPTIYKTTPELSDEELRYDVKEVLLYGLYWSKDQILSYPDKAVNLSSAQINGLLDKLSELDFSEENGHPLIGGLPVICTIVTGDDKYSLEFDSHVITIWPSEDELYTLEGRNHCKRYYFEDDTIFDYVKELHNKVKPDGIDPIF